MRAKSKFNEDSLQIALATYLDVMKLLWIHVPNESQTRASVQWYVKRKKKGVKPGFPDIVIFDKDKTVFIELKVDRNKFKRKDGFSMLSVSQKKWRDDLLALGYNYYIICARNHYDGLEQLCKILKEERL
jgi:hypothetical protein